LIKEALAGQQLNKISCKKQLKIHVNELIDQKVKVNRFTFWSIFATFSTFKKKPQVFLNAFGVFLNDF
jgi:hypothetical protein